MKIFEGKNVVDRMTYRMPLVGKDREMLTADSPNWHPSKEEAERFCKQYGLQMPPADGDEFEINFHDDPKEISNASNPGYFDIKSNEERRWYSAESEEGHKKYTLTVRISKNGEV
ncbi:hypothetical protein A3A38_03860 [Candidatus Kaiserbacteria bacterium RIFCSPLOWO2_01_FULL_53_17]|uniref:Uncharacterized protein n=1 Tax=Candidatus Kaiserbacteria bacterium RIFCSPLOWO2_01_FULL_53_17 TaxID=1798511 RepID=A0A1F6EHW0_9BACT|nr:MAG: hypothetical protein A3A38_03860 [Candidatus Kaiserbacteria bacterium RIFCSPLOWO2_01_FULL_53_17]